MAVNRNDPCPCGSGKKYKKCCMTGGGGGASAPRSAAVDVRPILMRAAGAHRAGRLDEAVRGYQAVLAAAPRETAALYGLGQILGRRGRVTEAIDLHERAINQKPAAAQYRAGLGDMLLREGRIDDALRACEEAIRRDKACAEAYRIAALSHERMGRLDEAITMSRRGLQISEDPESIVIAATIERRRGDLDTAQARLKTLLDSHERSMDFALRANAWSQLAIARDRAGETEPAWEAFCRAGAARREDPMLQIVSQTDALDQVAAYRGWQPPPREVSPDQMPAFLMGFPRSGTTLAEQMFSAHPGLHTTEEAPLLVKPRLMLTGWCREGAGSEPDLVANLSQAQVDQLRQPYWAAVAEYVPEHAESLLLDKQPLHLIDAPLLSVMFPGSKAIVMIRDPRDVCLSCFMQDFALNRANVNFLDIGSTVRFYVAVMEMYLELRDALAIDFHEVRYEAIVADPEPILRDALAVLDVPWNAAVLHFQDHAAKRFIATPSYEVVRGDLNTRAIGRWRRYQDHLAPYLDQLAPIVDVLGYE